jgi:hypothetical protein
LSCLDFSDHNQQIAPHIKTAIGYSAIPVKPTTSVLPNGIKCREGMPMATTPSLGVSLNQLVLKRLYQYTWRLRAKLTPHLGTIQIQRGVGCYYRPPQP